MSRSIVNLLVGTVGLWTAAPAPAQQPPRELHWTGDHWTAWHPPASAPEGAEIHVIEPGDTLWDLAARFYGDPYLWPQIWDQNRYIEDAHWIYPGDPLAVQPSVVPVESLAEGTEPAPGRWQPAPEWTFTGEEAGERRPEFARFEGAPEALGSESDITCSGYIGEVEESFDSQVIGSEHESLTPRLSGDVYGRDFYTGVQSAKAGLTLGDIVYLNGGAAQGMTPGRLLTVVEPAEKVLHPVSGDVVGRHYRYDGAVRVLSVQEESAIAEITQACRPIVGGAGLRPFEEEPVPLGRRLPMQPVNDPPAEAELADAPVVLHADAGVVSLGTGHLVYIDRGAGDRVAPGDLFTIYRANRVAGLPPLVLGELAVLSVRPNGSLARILESRYPVHVGDRLGARP
ncbi:MAG: LysM peptidoglycan-binding domain-containing protein [Thermoanaerobaculia bacterium]